MTNIRVTISDRDGVRHKAVYDADILLSELLKSGWSMPRAFDQVVRAAKRDGWEESGVTIGGKAFRVRVAFIGERLTVRNGGSVRAALTSLAGTRNPEVKRPDSMRGEIETDGRRYHWWAAAPVRGEHWCVDVESRTYVKISEPNKYLGVRLVTA